MTDDRAYRIHIHFEPEPARFTAVVPELGLSASAPTRAEVIQAVEQEIDARVQAAAAGEPLPHPIDVQPPPGPLALQLSAGLARELLFQAKRENLSPEALALELIARGIGRAEGRGGGPRRRPNEAPAQGAAPTDEANGNAHPQPSQERGEDRDRGRGGPPRHRGRQEGYRPELEDKANFLEYLRGLEKGGGGQGGGRRGRR